MRTPPKPVPTATLRVRVTPRASANAVTRFADGVLSLRLTAPPVEGAANAACCQFVAKLLGVSASHVTVKSGHKSRDKALTISSMTQGAVEAACASYEGS